jgi:hypothetical protein
MTHAAINAPIQGSTAMRFEPNEGQWDQQVLFSAPLREGRLFFTDNGFRWQAVRPAGQEEARVLQVDMRFAGASGNAVLNGRERLPGTTSYLRGQPSDWHRGLPNFARLQYTDLYPGIDAVFYGRDGVLEYDLTVHPGRNPDVIGMQYENIENITVADNGDLCITTPWAEMVEQKPYAYQVIDGQQHEVAASFVKRGPSSIGFDIGEYDDNRELIIDPLLLYSTYYGGNDGDRCENIAIDSTGSLYVVGMTYSDTNFPVTPDAFQTNHFSLIDIFVTKFAPDWSNIIYSTYIGGNLDEIPFDLALGNSNELYVTGFTESDNGFPTVNALQTSKAGYKDIFLLKLNNDGTALDFSTYVGGMSNDLAYAMARDGDGNIYIGGLTRSPDFPVTNAYQDTFNMPGTGHFGMDAFVAKFGPNGTNVFYSTFLGGSSADGVYPGIEATPEQAHMGLDVDARGSACIVGGTVSTNFPLTANAFQTNNLSYFAASGVNLYMDAFITKLAPDGRSLEYSTLIGGFEHDYGLDVTYGPDGTIYVAGQTQATNFPTTAGVFDPTNDPGGVYTKGFVVHVSPVVGTSLVYSTLFGGDREDEPRDIEIDEDGYVYVAGYTYSTNFPLVDPIDGELTGEPDVLEDLPRDAFALKISTNADELIFSTYFGGDLDEQAYGMTLDEGVMYLAGRTYSTNFVVKDAYQAEDHFGGALNQFDGFIAVIMPEHPDMDFQFEHTPGGVVLGFDSYYNMDYLVEKDTHPSITSIWEQADNLVVLRATGGWRSWTNSSFTNEYEILRIRASR